MSAVPRVRAEGASRMNDLRTSKAPPLVAIAIIATALVGAIALVALRLHLEPPVVPAYAIADSFGPGEVALSPGADFAIELRPAARVQGAIAMRGFLLHGDEVHPWDPPFSVDQDGTVHVAGRTEAIFAGVPDGNWEMAFAVGRPEVLPTAPLDVLRARDQEPGPGLSGSRENVGWHLVRRRISLAGLGPNHLSTTPLSP
jgi:hypothetical protein